MPARKTFALAFQARDDADPWCDSEFGNTNNEREMTIVRENEPKDAGDLGRAVISRGAKKF